MTTAPSPRAAISPWSSSSRSAEEESGAERIYHHIHDLESHGRVEVLDDMTRDDAERLHLLITRHARFTGSRRAAEILAEWKTIARCSARSCRSNTAARSPRWKPHEQERKGADAGRRR